MENKKVIGVIIGALSVVVIVLVVMMLKGNNKSVNIELNTNYKSLIGIKTKSDIILVIDDKDNVSNILYLNDQSAKTFANQKIEGKNLEKAIELVVDKLKNNDEFNDASKLVITRYDDNDIYIKVLSELNKEFVIYGVDNKIVEESSTLDSKIMELKISDSSFGIDKLYEYSKKILKNYEK